VRRGEVAAEEARTHGDDSSELTRESIVKEEYGRDTTTEVDEALERGVEGAERLDRLGLGRR
jgi:hypothetical protein